MAAKGQQQSQVRSRTAIFAGLGGLSLIGLGVASLWISAMVQTKAAAVKSLSVPSSLPRRVVSLDFCADQYVLQLADRDQIAALSTQSQAEHSYWRALAKGIPQVRDRPEAVLALAPDLVVQSYGGGPEAARLFGQTSTPVLQLGYGEDLDAIRQNLMMVAAALGHPKRGQDAIARLDQTLALAHRSGPPVPALYVTPGGVQAGAQTGIGLMMKYAGLVPFDQSHPGWSSLPLEKLASVSPPLTVVGFMQRGALELYPWSAARHPLIQSRLAHGASVVLPGAMSACPGSFTADAILILARGGDPLRHTAP